MVKVIDQNIPAELVDEYDHSLHRAVQYLPGSGLYSVRHRVPFRLPHMQDKSLSTPSAAQRLVRAAFKKCVNCFALQPKTGGVEPPAIGPRNRSWWYDQAETSGLWYYDYFIQQTWPGFYQDTPPDWCRVPATDDAFVYNIFPDSNFGAYTHTDIRYYMQKASLRHQVTYIKRPNSSVSTLHIHFILAYFRNQPIFYHQVTEPWEENTITWNNRPSLGPAIGSFPPPQGDEAKQWATLPNITSPSIALDYHILEEAYNGVGFESAESPDVNLRPFWT